MRTKENRPSAATLERAGAETAACGKATISYFYSTTSAGDGQLKISPQEGEQDG